jgi:hypothetical protein
VSACGVHKKKKSIPLPIATYHAKVHITMSDNRKRSADNQGGSREDLDRDSEEFVTTPQVASADVLATRRIISVRKPTIAPEVVPAAGSAAPTPFGSVLGSFGAATSAVAPSPFAAFGSAPAAAAVAPSPFAGFGGTPAAPVAPSPFAGFGSAPAAVKPAAGFGSGFNFGITPAAPAPAATESKKEESPAPAVAAAAPGGFNFGGGVKFDFGAAANSFSAAAANAAAKAHAAAEEAGDADEDPEAEVPIAAGAAGAPLLAATEVKTGEEGDETLFETHNAKLFTFHADDKSWHERGAGSFKVSKKADGTVTRVVMRDGKLKKVLLNCCLDKESFRMSQKQEKMFSFSAPNDGAVGTFLVKITGPTGAAETKAFLTIAEKIIA